MDIVSHGSSANADPIVQTIIDYGLERNIVELDAYGFTVIPPEKLGSPPGFSERLREAILDVYRRRHNVEIDVSHSEDLPADNTLYKQLVDEDDAITEAVLHPVTLAMARWHCGQNAVLGQSSSIIKAPAGGTAAEGVLHTGALPGYLRLHNDTHGVPPPQAAYPHFVNTSWVLTDYTSVEDGPTVFVPGSHRWGRAPAPHEAEFWQEGATIKPLPLQAKAGSLAVWSGNTWHGSVPRSTPGLRVTMVLAWQRSYMKPLDMWQLGGISPERVERFPELTRVLGLNHPFPNDGYQLSQNSMDAIFAAGQDQFA